jgi:hypothetical protein
MIEENEKLNDLLGTNMQESEQLAAKNQEIQTLRNALQTQNTETTPTLLQQQL